MPSLVFIHLSDIHFHSRSDSGLDLERVLRHELILDAKDLTKKLDPVTGILVCGDIAYSGQDTEYDIAARALKELCAAVGCRDENVFPVPGNHDVDRNMIRRSPIGTEQRKTLRLDRENAAEKLRILHQDALAEDIFYKPLQAYNLFASRYGCNVNATRPFWDKDLMLNDGSTLRIRGLTSVLTSDSNDNREAGKLVLGQFQTHCPREEGVTWLTLCHHPPDWLFDQDAVQEALDAQTQVQLFGHKHKQRLHLIETRFNKSLRLGSGALHPERDGGWDPRYNILALDAEGTGSARRLVVTVWARRWRSSTQRFDTDDSETRCRYEIPLASWSGGRPSTRGIATPAPLQDDTRAPKIKAGVADTAHGALAVCAAPPPHQCPTMDPHRRIVFRFATLPYLDQVRIVGELGLAESADQSLDAAARLAAYFARARERKQLAALWDAIEKVHPELAADENPFSNAPKDTQDR